MSLIDSGYFKSAIERYCCKCLKPIHVGDWYCTKVVRMPNEIVIRSYCVDCYQGEE